MKKIKDIVRMELDSIAGNYGYQPGQDSTSVITLKNQNYGMDIGILIENSSKDFCRLIHNKSTNSYGLEEISHSYQMKKKYKFVNQHGGSKEVKKRYLEMKNSNPETPSFDIYVNVVNLVFNQKGGQKMSKVSGNTHTQSQMNHHANQSNPNNSANRSANNNHANQCNPNNSAYGGKKK